MKQNWNYRDVTDLFIGFITYSYTSHSTEFNGHHLIMSLILHNQQFVSWVYLYLITAAAENTLISMGNTFSTCIFFEPKTNRTSVQTDCTILVFSK